MKHPKLLLGIVLFPLLFAAYSCTKNDVDAGNPDPVPPVTQTDSLLGKWNFISVTLLQPGGPGRMNIPGRPGDYWQFDSTIIRSNVMGVREDIIYKLVGDKIFYNLRGGTVPPYSPANFADTLFITTLTDKLLVVSGKSGQETGIDSLRR